jgi:hypothetical protein
VLPSVRGLRRLLTIAALLLTGAATAIVVGLAGSGVADRLLPARSNRSLLAALAAAFCVLLDVVWVRTGHPRPLAVHRQVPQPFGHRYGSFAAALRYGPRLGVGPATILTSWLWWAAFLSASIVGRWPAIVGALAFALVRVLTMFLIASGVDDGQHMARRMRGLAAYERLVRTGAMLAANTATAAVLIAAVAGLR